MTNTMTSPPKDLISFLNSFKVTIESTMSSMEKDINRNIDEKLLAMNSGIEKLAHDSRIMEEQQEKVNRNLEERLLKNGDKHAEIAVSKDGEEAHRPVEWKL